MATAGYLIHFEATVNAPGAPTPTLSACKVRRDQFNSLWQTVKAAYNRCSDSIVAAGESAADTKSILNPSITKRTPLMKCLPRSSWNKSKKAPPKYLKLQSLNSTSYCCRLPPIDTEVFSGDYLRWPTFLDLFIAIYIIRV